MIAYCSRWIGLASGLAPASMSTKRLLSVGIVVAMPARSIPGKGAQLDRAGRDGRARMSRADDRVGLAFFDEIDRPADGRILFLAHRGHRLVAHLHDLTRVDDFHARIDETEPLQLRFAPPSGRRPGTACSGAGKPPRRGPHPRQCCAGQNPRPSHQAQPSSFERFKKNIHERCNSRPADGHGGFARPPFPPRETAAVARQASMVKTCRPW